MIDPKNDKTVGYHLFLEPRDALGEELQSIITTLAAEYGGPVFTPHTTVLARIPAGNEEQVIAASEALAREWKSFSLTLGTLAAEDLHFRALYIQLQEQDAMKQLHSRADELFSMNDERPYLAHISLLYGNYPKEKKEQTMQSLAYPAGKSFVADRLHLYRTEGTTAEWFKVKEFTFGA